MLHIAVAGGTGGVGKTILEQLELASEYQVIVLTRSKPSVRESDAGTRYVRVQYGGEHIDELADTLREQQVHTVISTINIVSDETSGAQLSLIKAAIKSGVTRRFVPSEYGFINVPEVLNFDPTVQRWIDAASLLKGSPLQYTRFSNGFFMDYWGMPHAKTHLSPFPWAIDVFNKTAALPGDGEAIISLTHTVDLARFVVKMLEVDEWPEFSIVVGEDITFNDFLRLVERVRGSKFASKYDTMADLERGQVTLFPNPGTSDVDGSDQERKDYSILFGRLYVHGIFHMPSKDRLTERFPELRPVRLEEFLTEAWRGK